MRGVLWKNPRPSNRCRIGQIVREEWRGKRGRPEGNSRRGDCVEAELPCQDFKERRRADPEGSSERP